MKRGCAHLPVASAIGEDGVNRGIFALGASELSIFGKVKLVPANQRILLVSARPDLTQAVRREVERRIHWQLARPIDPRDVDRFTQACTIADVVLIEAEDLLWLLDTQLEGTASTLRSVCVVVILSDRHMLAVTTRLCTRYGLLLRRPNDGPPIELLSLAVEGYVVFSEALLQRISSNRFRLDIVEDFSPDLRQTLAFLGAALSNRQISEVSGMTESRVKTLVRIAMRRLCMRNRTAVAVFAATNGLAHLEEPFAEL